jgi:signal transduction histidine kinase/CheY-like chemotaxis protein/HPt (histidine-containing phosphotransfer) domain-containing protein
MLLEKTKSSFIKLSISQKIVFSFILLLLISFAFTAFNLAGLNDFRNQFIDFKQISANTNLMLKIDKDVSELQRSIAVFSQTEKNATMSSIYELHKTLVADVNQLHSEQYFNDKINNDLLNQLQLAIEKIREKIDSLKNEYDYRDTLVNTKLPALFKNIENSMSDIFAASEKNQNTQFFTHLWQAKINISQAQVLSGSYFNKHEMQLRNKVQNHLEETAQALIIGKSLTKKSDISDKISSTIQSIASIKIVFNQAVQADRNYLFLVNVVIAGESEELATLAEKLKVASLEKEKELFSFTKNRIELNQKIVLFYSIFGALLAIIIALFLGRYISKPLQSITVTFSRLANEEDIAEIPGMERRDEIGRLAEAANVFRETNVRTQVLLDQTKKNEAELKKREQELELAVGKAQEASISKSQFLANMSHELRTPMNAILGMLSLLRKTDLNARQEDYAAKTEGAARSLLSILNDILDVSKAEAGKIELDPIPFNLDHLLRDLSVILSANLTDKPVALHFIASPELPLYFVGDVMRLQQVLINLGSNAIKFTNQGNVTISVTLKNKASDLVTLEFSVIDTGIGISAENHSKIFNGFTQAEASTTRRFGGTGLGLAISQKLVTLMGGHLELESSLGAGSRFFFSIPLQLLNNQGIEKLILSSDNLVNTTAQSHLNKLHILLVEDNLNNQQIALELLEAEGAVVHLVDNGQKAVDILRTRMNATHNAGFDVVLMDLQMPVMDGLTATQIIRQELQLVTLPIIAMTANAMASDREECLNAGMNDHVGKPFDINQLVKVIREHLGLKNVIELATAAAPLPIQPETAEAFAQAIGIDLKGALNRFGGNKELYLNMLPKFLHTLNTLPAQLRSHENLNELHSASRLLHTLKGLAATMGAMELSAHAAKQEKILANQASHPEAHHIIEQMCSSIANTIPGLENLLAFMQTPNNSKISGQK